MQHFKSASTVVQDACTCLCGSATPVAQHPRTTSTQRIFRDRSASKNLRGFVSSTIMHSRTPSPGRGDDGGEDVVTTPVTVVDGARRVLTDRISTLRSQMEAIRLLSLRVIPCNRAHFNALNKYQCMVEMYLTKVDTFEDLCCAEQMVLRFIHNTYEFARRNSETFLSTLEATDLDRNIGLWADNDDDF